MLFRFCSLCCKSVDASFINFSRHYARALVNSRHKQREIDNDVTRTEEEKVPIITCKRKSFDFYKGQTLSKRERIILASDGWNHRDSRGDYFFVHPQDNDDKEEANTQISFDTFNDFNLRPIVCSHLESLDIRKPLQIQNLGIPKILEGSNTVLAAETGCGKTMAYLLPMINQILQWKEMVSRPVNCPLGLIVTPTRELAVQIALELIRFSKNLGIRTKIITGGKTKKMIIDPPVDHVDVIVSSFGVISKLTTVGVYKLNYVRYMVLDEADALFHYTFEDKLNIFMRRVPIGYHQEMDESGFPRSAQLILASATIPSRLQTVLGDIVNVDSLEYITTEKLHKILVVQKFMRVGARNKPAELLKYIKPKTSRKQSVIVFSNTNRTSYWLSLFLNECGITATNLNGTMPLHVRRGKYGEFLNGKALVLSTTNAGSRGLDTVMVNHVLNYDFPMDTGSYIHRCGRTGRIGTTGDCRVTNFICKPGEIALVQKIERAVRKMKPIPIINMAEPSVEEGDIDDMDMEEEYTEKLVENLDSAENIPY